MAVPRTAFYLQVDHLIDKLLDSSTIVNPSLYLQLHRVVIHTNLDDYKCLRGVKTVLKKKYFKTKEECEVTFEFNANGAKEVLLVGEFADWEPIKMKKSKSKNAPFKTKVRLPKDQKFQFRYLIDETVWANDEAADAYWANDQGSDNSVVFTNN